jgi:hypothetical protein
MAAEVSVPSHNGRSFAKPMLQAEAVDSGGSEIDALAMAGASAPGYNRSDDGLTPSLRRR